MRRRVAIMMAELPSGRTEFTAEETLLHLSGVATGVPGCASATQTGSWHSQLILQSHNNLEEFYAKS